MITFEHVSVRYRDGTVAVNDVNLAIPAGQFCVLLGSSGAGKTTLLKTVNGLTVPSAGAVRVGGVPVARPTLREVRRGVAMIHQQFNLVARATVERNVLAGGIAVQPAWRIWSGQHTAADRSRAAALCAQVGLQPVQFQRRAAELSGGQQQRVGIARAFFLDVGVVLADEPVASLDPQTSREVMTVLRAAARARGCTVVCSLHQLDLAREFADRIVGMRAGRVCWDVPADGLSERRLTELYGQPEPVKPAEPAEVPA